MKKPKAEPGTLWFENLPKWDQWGEWTSEIVAKLKAQGAPEEWIASIALDTSDPTLTAVAWPVVVSPSPMSLFWQEELSLSPDIQTLACLRYFAEHRGEDDANFWAIVGMIELASQHATNERAREENERLKPDAETGAKVRHSGVDAHRKEYGTPEEKRARWEAQAQAVADMRGAHPDWSDDEVRKEVAKLNEHKKFWRERSLRRAPGYLSKK